MCVRARVCGGGGGGVGGGGGGEGVKTKLCMLILCFDVGCFSLIMKCTQLGLT